MSPLRRKRLRVVLCPDKVAVAVWGGLRRKILSHAVLHADPANSADWRPAMAVLEQWLEENESHSANVEILLSNRFVRFAMLPFSGEVSNYAERLIVAGLLFESIYGETAKQWKLTLDDEEYGKPCLVAAIDSALWDALDQMISSRQWREVRIQPYATSVLNAFAEQIGDGDALLAVVEPGQAILIDIKDKNVVSVRKAMLSVDLVGTEIVSVLQREMLISGLNEEAAKVYLHVSGGLSIAISDDMGLDIIALRDESAGHEMACVEDVK